MKVFSVRACRWGDAETHSYIVGIYEKEQSALDCAEEEENFRGGKYECEILEHNLNTTDMRIVKGLSDPHKTFKLKLKETENE